MNEELAKGPTIDLTLIHQTKKPNTKTVWQTITTETSTITEEEYLHYIETVPWFRRIGSRQILTWNYTPYGYRVIKLVSISPDKEARKIYKFGFSHS